MTSLRILIADSDELFREHVKTFFTRRGLDVAESADANGMLVGVQTRKPHLIVFGPSLGIDGVLSTARHIRHRDPDMPIIVVTARSSEETAIAALRAGVTDYFKQPVSFDELACGVERCLGSVGARAGASPEPTRALGVESRLVGSSPVMREIKARIGKVAMADSNVLITGETGTGKELVAELIHANSLRSRRPLVSINCAAVPDSLLESELFGYERGAFTGAHAFKEGVLKLADGGTAFFDEIGDMSPYAQAKILRAIETKQIHRLGGRGCVPFDARVLAATNQDLERLIADGRFRRDLYFRLNVVRIHVPPLRERKHDIPALLDHYLTELNRAFGGHIDGFTDEALERFRRYDWPGNIRELKNVLEAIFVNVPSGRIGAADLPAAFPRPLEAVADEPRGERDRLLSALVATNWNKTKAAEKLHWSRMTVYRKMATYGLPNGGTMAEPSSEPGPQ